MSINFDTEDSVELEYYDVLSDIEMAEAHEIATRSYDPILHPEYDTREDYDRMILNWMAERQLTQISPLT